MHPKCGHSRHRPAYKQSVHPPGTARQRPAYNQIYPPGGLTKKTTKSDISSSKTHFNWNEFVKLRSKQSIWVETSSQNRGKNSRRHYKKRMKTLYIRARGHYEYYKFLANYGQTDRRAHRRTYGRTDITDVQTDISQRFLANYGQTDRRTYGRTDGQTFHRDSLRTTYVRLKFVCLFVCLF